MIKVYFRECRDHSFVPIIQAYKDHSQYNKNLYYIKNVLDQIKTNFVTKVDSVHEADFILCPHYYFHIRNENAYIRELHELAESSNKKILLFLFEDEIYDLHWPHTILFRSSLNRSQMSELEFSLPPVVADLSQGRGVNLLPKPKTPVVGFVGWAGFDSYKRALKAYFKNFYILALSMFRGSLFLAQNQQGIFLRRYLLDRVRADSRVQDVSVIRTKYAGFTRDFSSEYIQKQREEYIQNMCTSHFTLAPRGDGNFSQRFFECLSVGRFPVLVDTDSVLPLADIVPYERFVVMVPYNERSRVVDYIITFVNSLNEDEFIERQKEAKYYFDTYLSVEGYYRYLFIENHILDYTRRDA